MDNHESHSNKIGPGFAQAAEHPSQNLFQEFAEMLRHNKKW